MRDGVKVRELDGNWYCAPRIVVPVLPDEPAGISVREMFASPPVHVLLDRYNPDYEHYFADRVYRRDVYKLARRDGADLVYEYETTEEHTGKDYDRVNPALLRGAP